MRRTMLANYSPRVVHVDAGNQIPATDADVATLLTHEPELDAAIPASVP